MFDLHTGAGSVLVLQSLLAHGAEVDFQDNLLRSALHYAIIQGQVECVRELISAGADLNLPDQDLRAPAHHAALANQHACLQVLLQTGMRHRSPSTVAAGSSTAGYTGDDAPSTDPLPQPYTHGGSASSRPALLTDVADSGGQSALHLACVQGNAACVKLLLARRADHSLRDLKLRTPLHLACIAGSLDCISLLVESGASLQVLDASSRTPFHELACRGHVTLLRRLLTAIGWQADAAPVGAAVTNSVQSATTGSDALNASSTGSVDRLLLLNQRDAEGWTALHDAAAHGKLEVVQLLLAAGADPFIRDLHHWTARTHAVYYGHLIVAAALPKHRPTPHLSLDTSLPGDAFSVSPQFGAVFSPTSTPRAPSAGWLSSLAGATPAAAGVGLEAGAKDPADDSKAQAAGPDGTLTEQVRPATLVRDAALAIGTPLAASMSPFTARVTDHSLSPPCLLYTSPSPRD